MSFSLDSKTTTLVLIDLEHGIVSRDLAPHRGAEVVERSARLAEAFRAAGAPVVYVHALLHELHTWPSDKPMIRPPSPPPQASDLVPEAGYQPDTDLLVTKRQWDAFYASDLDQLLRRRGIRTVVIAGIATNMGVESTARSALARGYELVFAEDAISAQSAEMHRFAVEQIFALMGRVRSCKQIAEALS